MALTHFSSAKEGHLVHLIIRPFIYKSLFMTIDIKSTNVHQTSMLYDLYALTCKGTAERKTTKKTLKQCLNFFYIYI